jgi:hypothetical protein
VSDELKKEIRYYVRVAVTIGLALIAARLGIKIDPPPIQAQVSFLAPGDVKAK